MYMCFSLEHPLETLYFISLCDDITHSFFFFPPKYLTPLYVSHGKPKGCQDFICVFLGSYTKWSSYQLQVDSV